MDFMKYILTALFFVALPAAALSPPVLTGTASVIDGYRIRLQGIDAPETGKIRKKRVTCYPEGINDAKKSVGLCMLGDTDLSRLDGPAEPCARRPTLRHG